ncbi:MAG: IclR family transcriptional regulator, partial [Bryobacteraceae bacterium]
TETVSRRAPFCASDLKGTMKQTNRPMQVLVLHKTLDVLEAIKGQDAGMGLAELSRHLRIPKPTVYRILVTLETRGYLDRRPDGSFRMSEKMFNLRRDTSLEEALRRAARPQLEALVARCKETVNLGAFDGGEVVVIETVESPQSVRMVSKVGNRRALHSSALGKVLLSAMTDQEIRRLIQLKGLPKFTPKTLVTRAALLEEIRIVREQEFAVDDRENELEGRCIAAPIRGPQNRVAGAMSISVPVFRMDVERLKGLHGELRKACEKVSRALRG